MGLFHELADVILPLDVIEIDVFLVSAFDYKLDVVLVGSARKEIIDNKIIEARGQDRT
jgi:hypothetical protein